MIQSLLRALRAPAVFPPETDALIRSEIFSIERLEQHAASLAAAQQVTTRSRDRRHLGRRQKDNERVLFVAYRSAEKAVREERGIPPADEWLLDNFYVAQEPIRQIQRDLPPGFCGGLLEYTDAALWSVIAFAMLGDGDKAAALFGMLNPITHASTRAAIHRYKVEPDVVCADVYAEPSHLGRGGWTWYTGSAGWMHRAGLEWIHRFRLRGTTPSSIPACQKHGLASPSRSHTGRPTTTSPSPTRRASAAESRVSLLTEHRCRRPTHGFLSLMTGHTTLLR